METLPPPTPPPDSSILDMERLDALRATGLLDSPPDLAFDRLVKLVRRLLNVPVSLVSLIDIDRQFFKSSLGLPEPWATMRQTPLSHSFCQHVVSNEKPLVIEDARDHPLVCDNLAIRDLNVIAYLGIPLHAPGGQIIGSLCAIDGVVRTWTDDDIEVLTELAALVMKEIELQFELRERLRAEQALAEKAEALKRSNEELEQFASVASHDLQEPLRTISSFVQLLQKRYQHQLDENADQYIDFIVDATSHMQALIKDLLAYSRIESQPLNRQPTDVAEVLEQVLGSMRTAIAETEATVTHDPLPTLEADRTQLHSLLHNLINNGIKFRGETTPHLHISSTRKGKMWCLSIKDNGIGIEEVHLERIFRLFHRLHTRRHYEGTGIGLTICKRIVDRHGGDIWVESVPGKGTTFYFTIPA